MADYNEADLAAASAIIGPMINKNRENIVSEFREDIFINDIEKEVSEFREDADLLRQLDRQFPAYRFGEFLVPVALSLIFPNNWVALQRNSRYWRHDNYIYDFWLDSVRDMYAQLDRAGNDGNISLIPIEQAINFVKKQATDFLANRISFLRTFNAGDESSQSKFPFLQFFKGAAKTPIPTPGCTFSVSSKTSGLRVFWSVAFRINPNFFSAPTSPVSSTLQSGTYVFGVDGGAYGSTVQWDHSAVITLPGANPSLTLNF